MTLLRLVCFFVLCGDTWSLLRHCATCPPVMSQLSDPLGLDSGGKCPQRGSLGHIHDLCLRHRCSAPGHQPPFQAKEEGILGDSDQLLRSGESPPPRLCNRPRAWWLALGRKGGGGDH